MMDFYISDKLDGIITTEQASYLIQLSVKGNGQVHAYLYNKMINLDIVDFDNPVDIDLNMLTFPHVLGIGSSAISRLIPLDEGADSSVEELNINNFNSPAFEHFGRFKNLKRINTGGPDLVSIYFIQNIPSLRELRITDSNISEIKGLTGLPNLEELNLSYNKFTSLKGIKNLSDSSKLRYIDLRHNEISDLNGLEPLKGLSGLRELNLDHNKLEVLDAGAYVPSLESLSINHNAIKKIIKLESLPELSSLQLA